MVNNKKSKQLKNNILSCNLKLPYRFAFANYDLSNYQHRTLMQLFIHAKEVQEGKAVVQTYQTGTTGYTVELKIKASNVLANGDKHHEKLYNEIKQLAKKEISYFKDMPDGSQEYVFSTAIHKFVHNREGLTITFPNEMWELANEYTKGYRLVDLNTLFQLQGAYAIRFYQMFANQQGKKRIISLDELKEMFCLQGKYADNKTFIARVVETAKKELDEKSPISYTYKPLTMKNEGEKGGRPKINAIEFHVTYNPIFDIRAELMRGGYCKTWQELMKEHDMAYQLYETLKNSNRECLNDPDKQIKGKNLNTIEDIYRLYRECYKKTKDAKYQATKVPGVVMEFVRQGQDKKNLVGWVVKCLQNYVKELQGVISQNLRN